MKKNTGSSGSYRLQLNDHVRWNLKADSIELQSWVEKLAGIMELDLSPVADGDRRISFITNNNGGTGHPCTPKAPADGWRCHDFNTLCAWYHDDNPDVTCTIKPFDYPEMETLAMWNALYPLYVEIVHSGGLPLHAGLGELDGKGVIIAGPGDTGKSTCLSRLPEYWNPLCDDEALVVVDNETNFKAHPFPTWSDRLHRKSENTWNVQHSVPLSGIFFIEQWANDEVMSLGEGKAAVYINESATQVCRKYWRRVDEEHYRTFRKNLFENACRMAKRIPAFKLRVSLHGRFWEKIERVLAW
ncbi:MAG: SynChlorMet cassette protein ScmC [Deltaproteobacteria bacterium]|nr:SynChlorMet cassette protein ScmC [Deltaproteobacteria bacterium]